MRIAADTLRALKGMRLVAPLSLLALSAPAALAGDWSVYPTITLQGQYHSNLRLGLVEELDTTRSSIDAALGLRRETETSELAGEFHWINLRHSDAEFADSDDYTASVSLSRWLSTFQFALSADAARENTLATEFDDTGIVDLGVQRDRRIIGASALWRPASTVTWGLELRDENSEYEDSPAYVDYTYQGAALFRQSELNERTSLTVRADYSEFETDDGFTSAETAALTVGIERDWSETLSLRASVGRTRTHSEDTFIFFFFLVREESTDYGWTTDLALRKNWQFTLLDISAGQEIRPSGQGALTTRHYLDATLRHDLSERSSLRLTGGIRRFDDTSELTRSNNDREYGQITLAFDHDLSRRWRLTGELTHRTQEFDRRDDVARGNIASISLKYLGGRL